MTLNISGSKYELLILNCEQQRSRTQFTFLLQIANCIPKTDSQDELSVVNEKKISLEFLSKSSKCFKQHVARPPVCLCNFVRDKFEFWNIMGKKKPFS